MQLGHSDSGSAPRLFKAPVVLPKPVLLGVLVIVLGTLAAYSPAFSAGFIWDDDTFITQNPDLRDLNGLWQIWFNFSAAFQYYPLVYSAFWLECHLWGLQPLGFHVVNVLLHIVGALLLWRILVRLNLPWAWLAAAIFALHPLQVESVAWVSELKNVLSGVFYFSAALCCLRFAGVGGETKDDRWRWHFYLAALFFFIAALLSKTVTCSLPAAMLLVLWWKKERLQPRDFFLFSPFFLIGIVLGLASAWFEKHHVGAQGTDWSLTFAERCLIAGRAVWFYAAKLVWPIPLTFIYPRWEINTRLWWQWLFPAAAVVFVCVLWLARRRIGKGPLTAVLFFGGTVLPALGFTNVYPMRFSFVADHFQYLAGIGLILLGLGFVVKLFECRHTGLPLQKVFAALLLLIYGVLTWQQCHIYQNLETLWTDTLKKNPRCWMAHTNLARLLVEQGKFDEAERHYQEAIGVRPDDNDILYNYGNLLVREGRLDEAAEKFRQALKLAPDVPDIHNNLGIVLFKQKRIDEAVAQFEQAIRCDAGQPFFHYNLGNALAAEHKTAAADMEYRRALRLDPDFEPAKKRLQPAGAPAN